MFDYQVEVEIANHFIMALVCDCYLITMLEFGLGGSCSCLGHMGIYHT